MFRNVLNDVLEKKFKCNLDVLEKCLKINCNFRTLEYLEEVAIDAARQLAAGTLKVDRKKKSLPDKLLNFALQYDWVKNQIFNKAKTQVMKMTGGLYPAPLKVNYCRNKFIFIL